MTLLLSDKIAKIEWQNGIRKEKFEKNFLGNYESC